MSLDKLITEDRRLVILRLLNEQPDYSLNSSLMQSALFQFGHSVSRDVVRSDFAWLAEQQLLTVDQLSNELYLAKINNRGVDVAVGLAIVPGIKRPGPGD